MRARKRAKTDFVFKSLWKHSYSDSKCSSSEIESFSGIYGNCDEKVKLVKTKKSIYRFHKYDKIRTNPNCYRHQMVVTKTYICTVSEDFDFSYIAINDRVTMEQVGYLETPHVGEWGYDYEIDGIYEDDILVTRACGPPHEIRFWDLENICTMEVGDIQPLKEIIIDSGLEWVDNEALNINISKNFIQCTPCDYPDEIYSIQKGPNYFKKLDLPQDKPENEAQEYYHQKISDNHLLVWSRAQNSLKSAILNTSRQIGGWISTAFTEPQRYFLRLYRFENVNSADPALKRLSDLDLPRGHIHGELLSHQIYESNDGVFLLAKDGHRVRESNKLSDREMYSSRVHVINLLTGELIWSGPVFSNGSFNSCGIYPKLRLFDGFFDDFRLCLRA
ncbi:unnamed protein product [Oikopleura dioica]|uniref:Uncharacterized protein n=1 Tax=Oikopleura dioica TaxID=34765 RepID=E4X2Z7_OIKDI|nr:unnamed protein product [Oikopleura dioica]